MKQSHLPQLSSRKRAPDFPVKHRHSSTALTPQPKPQLSFSIIIILNRTWQKSFPAFSVELLKNYSFAFEGKDLITTELIKQARKGVRSFPSDALTGLQIAPKL
jgi:hypothetical protein